MKYIIRLSFILAIFLNVSLIQGTVPGEYNKNIETLRRSGIDLPSPEGLIVQDVVNVMNKIDEIHKNNSTLFSDPSFKRGDELATVVVLAIHNKRINVDGGMSLDLRNLSRDAFRLYADNKIYSYYTAHSSNFFKSFSDWMIKHGYTNPKTAFLNFYSNPSFMSVWNVITEPIVAGGLVGSSAMLIYAYNQYKKNQFKSLSENCEALAPA